MIKDLFKISENGYGNYRATFTKIDAVFPIPGADRLVRAVVCGRDVVISKDLPLGNTYVYIPIETCLSYKYLSVNNLYRISSESYMLNENCDKVNEMIANGKSLSELGDMGGFFEKNGRVKQIKIRGVYSQGYLCDIESLRRAYPILNQFMIDEFDELIGSSFDVIGDEVFCEKWFKNGKHLIDNTTSGQKLFKKRQKTLKRASIIIPGQFAFHYDTKQFGDCYKEFTPDDKVTLTVKVHGSSGIFANVKCYKRKEDCSILQKLFYWIHKPSEYRLLYASRTKIRNEKVYDVERDSHFFYGSDIWGPVRDLLEEFIPRDTTIYGEICGYVEGTTKMIQKGHDYGCKPGQWKFMPYRIVTNYKKERIEWGVDEVIIWTNSVINKLHTEGRYSDAGKIIPMTLVYEGRFGDMYKDVPEDKNWNINILERMKNDRDIIGMECQEPLCKMKAPREGVVIRKINDNVARAWKLKSAAHYELEKKSHDAGDSDMEEES